MSDNFLDAYLGLYSKYTLLCGGYYEPYSTRDYAAGTALSILLKDLSSVLTLKEKVQLMKQGVDTRTLDMDDILVYPNGSWRFAYESPKSENQGEPSIIRQGDTWVYKTYLEGLISGSIPEARSL